MIEKCEALRIILGAAPAPTLVEEVPLASALSRVLARDVVADLEMPPFEKSSMDGWAVKAADVSRPGATLEIIGEVMAGTVPDRDVLAGEAMKVMTGAPIPNGADTVIMVERAEVSGNRVTFSVAAPVGQHICHRGEDVRVGDTMVRAGTLLDAAAVGVLAMVGCEPVPTFRLPTVCIVPTGDELVDPGMTPPKPGQIRESNGFALAMQVAQVSPAFSVTRPGIARDTRESIHRFLDVGLGHDVLCLSGGVSMGDLDLVGVCLKDRGLEVLVEKVRIKPGKPLLFGRVRGDDGHVCHVFGLPGNPVSTFVTFELFVRPFLLAMMGTPETAPPEIPARLVSAHPLRVIGRTQHVPAIVESLDGVLSVTPVEWHGSADLRGLMDANGLIVVAADGDPVNSGDTVTVHLLPGRTPNRPHFHSRRA